MSDRRFDNRSKAQFKKDIKFGTKLESYFFQGWLKETELYSNINVTHWSDNGVNNDGEYIETGKSTFGADYRVTMKYAGHVYEGMPLEVKWVPTAGKFTLKIADLKAYVNENAGILFVYNSNSSIRNLRKPKNHDWESHVENIEDAIEHKALRWGIMCNDTVKRLYDKYVDNCYPIPYMGDKMGFILDSDQFSNWFTEEDWHGQ